MSKKKAAMSHHQAIPEPYRSAHKESGNNKELLLRENLVGCFNCLTVFPPSDIKEWIDDDSTGVCPHCNVDSVLPYTKPTFLVAMNKHWFTVVKED